MGNSHKYVYPQPRGQVTEAREPIPVTIMLLASLAPTPVQGVVEAWSTDMAFGKRVGVVRVRFEVGGKEFVQWKYATDVHRNGPPPRV